MSPPDAPSPERGAAEALCTRCALCCDGSLFGQVPLAAGEADAARRLRLAPVPGRGGAEALPQPCAALRGRLCAHYEGRPRACRAYRCMLLQALDAGELTIDEAAAIVDEARARLDEARRDEAARERATSFLARRFLGAGRR